MLEDQNNKFLCIYHGNCADGFAAAWVVRKAKGEDRVEFVAGVYQTPPPDVEGRDVILVDFSYKRPVLLAMAERANSILIIDHHKTAAEDLVNLPDNVTARFDMGHSGAMLTWLHFFPLEEPPALLRHIEDRDLWAFKLPFTREIQAAVFSYRYDFEVWDDLMYPDNLQELIAGGAAIERKHFKDIHELLPVVTRPMQFDDPRELDDVIVVQVANLPYIHSSDAGHILAVKHPAGVGACYWDTPDGRVFSLRSTDDGMDVSAIAKQYGGGGHAHAAGFKVSYEKAKEFEIS